MGGGSAILRFHFFFSLATGGGWFSWFSWFRGFGIPRTHRNQLSVGKWKLSSPMRVLVEALGSK
jgi:hypothetical protein